MIKLYDRRGCRTTADCICMKHPSTRSCMLRRSNSSPRLYEPCTLHAGASTQSFTIRRHRPCNHSTLPRRYLRPRIPRSLPRFCTVVWVCLEKSYLGSHSEVTRGFLMNLGNQAQPSALHSGNFPDVAKVPVPSRPLAATRRFNNCTHALATDFSPCCSSLAF